MGIQFKMFDTEREDGVYVTFRRLVIEDTDSDPREYLFQDDAYRAEDQARLDAWLRGDWHFFGIQARADIEIVENGTATLHSITSPGLWAIESDSSDEYLAETYSNERAQLEAHLRKMSSFVENKC